MTYQRCKNITFLLVNQLRLRLTIILGVCGFHIFLVKCFSTFSCLTRGLNLKVSTERFPTKFKRKPTLGIFVSKIVLRYII